MKKIVLMIIVVGSMIQAKAQTFKPFKVNIATGYAIPSGEGSSGGVSFTLEPKYALNDNITVGLRLEGALTANVAVDSEGDPTSGDVKLLSSYLATSDYYLNTNKFRPFAGIGAGLFRIAGASFSDEDIEDGTFDETDLPEFESKVGFAPRLGFEYGHFRTAIEYNLIGKSDEVKNNYLGFKIGFNLGGGRL